jgi:hypothetical protein
VVHHNWDEHRVLPWDHLEGPIARTTLYRHQQEAFGI